jgi:DDE_Tnp_1-associated/Transposase DDE domain
MAYYPPGSLVAFLAEVPDPRDPSGKRHPLTAMLAHACCAIRCGCRGYAAIARWGRDQPIEFMHRLGYRRRPPSFGCFQGLLSRIDAAALEAALARWVAHRLGAPAAEALRALALDGKSLRGSLTAHAAAVHLLAAMDQATGCVLGQLRVDARTNEHKAALELLAGLALQGRVVTGDAMFCQRDLSRQVIEAGGHYLWKVDDNQPSLKEAIASAFEPACSPLWPAPPGR